MSGPAPRIDLPAAFALIIGRVAMPPSDSSLLAVDVRVRGYELDQWGHVNNAVFLNYFEHARWQLGARLPMFAIADGPLPVVRHVTLDYQCEARMHDHLRVALWPRRVGTTSFVFGGIIRICAAGDGSPQRAGRIACAATMVMTCFRRGEGKVPVPAAWRAAFPANDPGEQPPPGL